MEAAAKPDAEFALQPADLDGARGEPTTDPDAEVAAKPEAEFALQPTTAPVQNICRLGG
eukprot:SAG11_NODE_1258_length_5362_cov_16.457534_5_plen_59_part_00